MPRVERTALREKLDALPDRPGVYLYRNAANQLLYVGKAKSLRSRVRSYFQLGAQHAPRTVSLVAEIADLETIVVDTEMEALMLEANFIKKERPPYNVILRDDKSFPYLGCRSCAGRASTRTPTTDRSFRRRSRGVRSR